MSNSIIYSPEQEEEFFDHIDQVYALAESGAYQEAEVLLLEIEESVSDPKENHSIGNILLDSIFSFYEQAGQPEKALPFFVKETDYLKELMKTDTVKHPVHFVTLGGIYYALNDLDQARVNFKLAFSLKKGSVFQDFNPDFLHIARISAEEFEAFKKDFVPQTDAEAEDLTEEQQSLIDDFCEKADLELDKEDYPAAVSYFNKALAVLPEPKEDWEAAGWLQASIGDAYFNDSKYTEALEPLLAAQYIYGDEEANPFVLLRLGEVYFELNDHKNAGDYLWRAYKLEGEELFEDDKKYLNFLKKQHQL
ncbi:tetratricopeptide repeat protein [Pedobacter sp. AW31-3R]|uniref:tetratricopeptide repeat protein n=1 Tax=Pedobacter sp. AW31-3R TaxID=3445781 RepID=UPI003FA03373